jgi:hypothetical protein
MNILARKWANVANFCSQSKTHINPIQHDPHGPNDPLGTINYHHLDVSGHDGMDEQDIGWKNGWCQRGFWLGSWANVADFCSQLKPLIQLSMIHMVQMILWEPSIIIIWTYQDMMEWMSRILV